ncbi:MAG: tellurite resistance TerB family protein, partial [Gemmatimonadaceae bacterium]|nr:tellurite resistance TerB family protein [Acetobacteraceae bacterium]
MPHRYTHIDSARLELLEAVLDHRGALLMEAMVAACAIVAHADGRVQPGEPQRMLAAMRTDPLLSAFPRAA